MAFSFSFFSVSFLVVSKQVPRHGGYQHRLMVSESLCFLPHTWTLDESLMLPNSQSYMDDNSTYSTDSYSNSAWGNFSTYFMWP